MAYLSCAKDNEYPLLLIFNLFFLSLYLFSRHCTNGNRFSLYKNVNFPIASSAAVFYYDPVASGPFSFTDIRCTFK